MNVDPLIIVSSRLISSLASLQRNFFHVYRNGPFHFPFEEYYYWSTLLSKIGGTIWKSTFTLSATQTSSWGKKCFDVFYFIFLMCWCLLRCCCLFWNFGLSVRTQESFSSDLQRNIFGPFSPNPVNS